VSVLVPGGEEKARETMITLVDCAADLGNQPDLVRMFSKRVDQASFKDPLTFAWAGSSKPLNLSHSVLTLALALTLLSALASRRPRQIKALYSALRRTLATRRR
jgi:hypothetical protein